MRIEAIRSNPYERTVGPAISFDVEISYIKFQEAIVSTGGWLLSNDGRILAQLNEEVPSTTQSSSIGARGSHLDPQFAEDHYKTTLVSILDKNTLTHIETTRMADRLHDVRLTLSVKVKTIVTKAVVSSVHRVNPQDIGLQPKDLHLGDHRSTGWKSLVYEYTTGYCTDCTNGWLISGNSGPIFLDFVEQTLTRERVIPSSEWLLDYAPKLELGEYFIVEIPKGDKTIADAWTYLEKAEACFRSWDTKGVYANCREAATLLDKNLVSKLGKGSFAYEERWCRTYKRFSNISFADQASLDLHLEDVKKSYPPHTVKIGMADAEHLLIVTKALTKFAEELMHET